jgi:23S rRNA (uracil1939-C5)-methyltransferase
MGLPRPLRRALIEARVPRLTYASCHPATLARDLRDLVNAYTVTRLSLVDLFPQTGHIEMVVELEASAAPEATGPGSAPTTAAPPSAGAR